MSNYRFIKMLLDVFASLVLLSSNALMVASSGNEVPVEIARVVGKCFLEKWINIYKLGRRISVWSSNSSRRPI